VLDDAAGEALELALETLALGRERAHLAALGPLDLGVDVGERQAALLEQRQRTRAVGDLDVDQHEVVLGLAARIEHQDALVQAHLRRGEPDAVGRAHALEHRGHDGAQALVEARDRLGDLAQHGLGIQGQREFQLFRRHCTPVGDGGSLVVAAGRPTKTLHGSGLDAARRRGADGPR
jgi:hypothetical protein